MKSSSKFSWQFRIVMPMLTGAAIIAIWYSIKIGFNIHDFILPSPHDILFAFAEEKDSLMRATTTTFLGASLGFSVAVLLGFSLSLALVSFPTLRYSVYPFVIFMQMTPIIATAAIIVILFDVGLQSVVLIAFLIGFFPIVASSLQGLQSVPEGQKELFRLYKASPMQELIFLRIPYSLPYFFTGVKIAATLAIIGSVTGEIFAGSSDGSGGLGFMIMIYKSDLKIAAIYAATLICCVLGFIFVAIVLFLKWLALRHWHESQMPAE